MSTSTSKGLVKAAEAGETVDVKIHITDNFQRINDFGMGAYLCTSATRPTGSDRWDGLIIKETDTGALGQWDAAGNRWIHWDTQWQNWNGVAAQPGKHLLGTTQTPSVGATGIDKGKYMRNGLEVTYQTLVSWSGAGVVAGSGTIVVPIPFELVHDSVGVPIGTFFANDSGSGSWWGYVQFDYNASPTATKSVRLNYTAGTGTPLLFNSGAPSPWPTQLGAAGDQIGATMRYFSNGVAVTAL